MRIGRKTTGPKTIGPVPATTTRQRQEDRKTIDREHLRIDRALRKTATLDVLEHRTTTALVPRIATFHVRAGLRTIVPARRKTTTTTGREHLKIAPALRKTTTGLEPRRTVLVRLKTGPAHPKTIGLVLQKTGQERPKTATTSRAGGMKYQDPVQGTTSRAVRVMAI